MGPTAGGCHFDRRVVELIWTRACRHNDLRRPHIGRSLMKAHSLDGID